jgi:hypothetical protein
VEQSAQTRMDKGFSVFEKNRNTVTDTVKKVCGLF